MSKIQAESNSTGDANRLVMVCSRSVQLEQVRKRKHKLEGLIMIHVPAFRTFLCSLFGWLILLLGVGSAAIALLYNPCVAIPIAGTLVICAFFFSLLIARTDTFPTNIVLSPEGFAFAWHETRLRQSETVPWTAVESISARTFEPAPHSNQKAGHVLDLRLNLRMLPKLTILRLIIDTVDMWTGLLPFTWQNGLPDLQTVSISFPLDSLTLESDRSRLISAIRTWANCDVMSNTFKGPADANKLPTFTQVWLDDMLSFRRRRIQDLPAGETLQEGRYLVMERITAGGQAQIYHAIDTETDSPVALKEFVLPVDAGADVRNRSFTSVKNEALLLAGLSHPGLVKLLDHFVEDHRAYLVLEHVKGASLRRLVQDCGPLNETRALSFVRQMCDILDYLHEQSPAVVHRDFTPDNLMVTPDNRLVLLDFNVAHLMESDITKTVVGKHAYMAPEQFRGRPCPQSDLYSLGCTIYFMLTGKDPIPLSQSKPSDVPAVTAAFDAVVARLTSPEVAARYASASEVLSDIESVPAPISVE